MIKLLLSASFTFFLFFSANAQVRIDKDNVGQSAKVVFAEIGGPGVASINYDTRLSRRQDGLGVRVGIGGFSIEDATVIFVPVGLNYIVSKDRRNYFEVGAGVTPILTNESGDDPLSTTFGHLNIGYRLQPAEGGFFFKAAINPIFGRGFFWPYYAGIGFGYKF